MTNEVLFKASPLPMWVYDRMTLKFLLVNEAAVKTYGYTEEEFLAMESYDLCPQHALSPLEVYFGEKEQQQIHKSKTGADLLVTLQLKSVPYPVESAVLAVVTHVRKIPYQQTDIEQYENRFSELIQDGRNMISIFSTEMKYTYLNPRWLKFMGHAVIERDVIGHSILEFIDKRDQELFLKTIGLIDPFESKKLEPFRIRNSRSEIFWLEALVINLIEDTSVGGYLCSFKDVSSRMHDEQRLKDSAERYEILSKATSDTIWDWNLLTGKITWNKGIKGIFGYKNIHGNLTSSEWWAAQIHPEDRNRVTQNMKQHIINGTSRWKEEYRFCCADGSYKYVLDRGFMVFDEQGVSSRMICSMQDISQRKLEEEWSRLLESVVINATDAVLICTGNVEGSGQAIIYVNEAFTRMSGYQRQELIGASPRISQGPGTDLNEINRLSEAIARNEPCEIEVINYTKQGKEYWVSQSNAPIADETGKVSHWISIQRDVTLNKMHMKEIEQQNKKFREIAWIQSHVVRAPLARVMGLVDLLKNFEPGDDHQELLLHLENSAKELDTIIVNIADKTPPYEG